jgi:hypothetical protein
VPENHDPSQFLPVERHELGMTLCAERQYQNAKYMSKSAPKGEQVYHTLISFRMMFFSASASLWSFQIHPGFPGFPLSVLSFWLLMAFSLLDAFP